MTQGSPPWYITHTEDLLHDYMKLLLVNLLVSRLVQKTCDATYYVILYQHLGVTDVQQLTKLLRPETALALGRKLDTLPDDL